MKWLAALPVCCGLLGAASATAMDFSVVDRQAMAIVQGNGPIKPGDSGKLKPLLLAKPRPSEIRLNSPGGSVGEAMLIGNLVREFSLGASVRDGASCASACVLILAGGVVREVDSDARVEVHMASAAFSDDAYIQRLREILLDSRLTADNRIRLIVLWNEQRAAQVLSRQADYLQKMGISLRLLFEISSTSHLDGKRLSGSQLKDLNLVNVR